MHVLSHKNLALLHKWKRVNIEIIHNRSPTFIYVSETVILDCSLAPLLQGICIVIFTAQLHSAILELRFWAGSNPAWDVSDIWDD